MYGQGQNPDDAVATRNAWMLQQLEYAREGWAHGSTSNALTNFGQAIHPLMDLTSPEHTYLSDGYREPKQWCGFRCTSDYKHVFLGHQDVADITDEIYALEDEAIRDAYSFMTGTSLRCRKKR